MIQKDRETREELDRLVSCFTRMGIPLISRFFLLSDPRLSEVSFYIALSLKCSI
jgi:hypothetical protein